MSTNESIAMEEYRALQRRHRELQESTEDRWAEDNMLANRMGVVWEQLTMEERVVITGEIIQPGVKPT